VSADRLLQRFKAPTDATVRIPVVRAAVLDIGSNTARLLVAEQRKGRTVVLREEGVYLGLGAEILHNGSIGAAKLAETAEVAQAFSKLARKSRADEVEVIVTAPGRQADNPEELLATIARATGTFARILSAREEGELAYEGALTKEDVGGRRVAVCDLGGGSTEIVVGDAGLPSFWCTSVDLGSLRLTAACLPDDPPSAKSIAAAERLTLDLFAEVDPPDAELALAVGGSARALAKLVGPSLGEAELTIALELSSAKRSAKVAKNYELDAERARVLPAGAIVLREVTRRLGQPLRLARGGLREATVGRMFAEAQAA
jgi:exopolyphosphatase/guanosine-5'-triphosphate,3'-diphosphate pyrophosphatase